MKVSSKRICAYCGRDGLKLEREHTIPSCLYPDSLRGSTVQRLTVPSCAECNRGWSDDEAHFRALLLLAGDPNSTVTELWTTDVMRSFAKVDAKRRLTDLWDQMHPFESSTGPRHRVSPASDPRFMRVIAKVVRGLHFHHFGQPVRECLVQADVLRFNLPTFSEELPVHHREMSVFQYRFAQYDDEDGPSSAWLLTFFENKHFVALVNRGEAPTGFV